MPCRIWLIYPLVMSSCLQESSGQYWGLAFPLNPQVLLPSEPAVTAAPPPACDSCPMPLQLSRLYTNSQYQHDPGQCLKCYDVKVSSVRAANRSWRWFQIGAKHL